MDSLASPVCLSDVLWCTVCVAGWENYQGVGSSNEANGSSTRHNTGHNWIGSNKAQQGMIYTAWQSNCQSSWYLTIEHKLHQTTSRVVFLHNDWTNRICEGCIFRNRPFLELGHIKTPPNLLAKFKTPMAAILNSGWALPCESDPDLYILHFWNLWDETCWDLP